MDKQFNLITVIEAVQKRFWAIVIITILVGVGVIVITHPKIGIVAPEYESTTMFYPANLSLMDRPYVFESQQAVEIDFDHFGRKEDVDRLVSVAVSGQVLKHLLDKYNLIDHYKINREKVEFPETSGMSKLKKKYAAFKNEYNAIQIIVKDENPQMAANLANEAVQAADRVHREMVMEGRERLKKVLEKQIAAKNTEVEELSNRLNSVSEPAQQKTLEVRHVLATEQLTRYLNILEQFNIITADDLSTVRIMEIAYPSEEETGHRWLVIFGAVFVTLGALVFGATILHVMTK